MKAVLFDLDGVLYEGENAIEGAADAVEYFRQESIPHLFVTNTSSRPRSALVEKLQGLGLEISTDDLHTPPAAAAEWLQGHRIRKVALLIREATQEEFSEFTIAKADDEDGVGAVVVGDLGDAWDYHTLNRGFRLLMQYPKPVLIALGMTKYWKGPEGLQLDAAPFVVGLEHAADTEAKVLGKPAAAFFEAALHKLGVQARDTVMIGDDINSDIGGAAQNGLHTVLVRTGKFQPSDLSRDDIKPNAVIPSIADFPDWWKRNQ